MDGNSQHLRRRLSAVLCADVVGYSAQMLHDERATHLAYKATIDNFILPHVTAHFGSLVKSTGDGFFAQFDSVVSAMECALAIQAGLSEFQTQNVIVPALRFRLGVSSGDVISEKEDIYGNDVNLAARLQEQAQPGTICITAGTYEQVRAKLTAQFEDLGEITFKNSGEATRVYACYPKGAVPWVNQTVTQRFWRHSKKFWQYPAIKLATACVVLALLIGGLLTGIQVSRDGAVNAGDPAALKSAPNVATKQPSIAVLAFENRSQSPETRALSLGVGDTIATALAASQRFFVIDPKSSLEFSSASPSLQNIAQQLGVRFLLLGSVNQKGRKIRINARLVDMETGRNHWAYSVLEDVNKIFDIEDRITTEVIEALSEGPRSPAGKGVRGTTRNITAYQSFLKGWQLLRARPIPKFDEAIPYFQKAVLYDPNYGNAHAALAAAYVKKSLYFFATIEKMGNGHVEYQDMLLDLWSDRQNYLDKARTFLSLALKEPTAYTYRVSAQIHFLKNDHKAAALDARRAYLQDPYDADSAAEYGMSLIWNGETDDGIKEIEKAMRINPKAKESYSTYLGIAKFVQRHYSAALTNFETALESNPHNQLAMIHKIAAHGHLNEIEKGRTSIEQLDSVRNLLGLTPAGIHRILRNLPYKHQSSRLQLTAGLHKAGMKYGIEQTKVD